jgi:N-acetylmuramoyl-L-alanine amidase
MKFIIDTGHGGIDPTTGKYVTAGKRMVKDDVTFYEGVNNRLIAKEVVKACQGLGLDCQLLFDSWKDLSLGTRVNLANDLYFKNNKKVFLISIHSDALGDGKTWRDAKGVTVFTSKGQTKSDKFATVIYNELVCELDGLTTFRRCMADGDPDKEADFQILRQTNCPAVLLELGFHTHKEEVKLIAQKTWHLKVAKGIASACYEIDNLERI